MAFNTFSELGISFQQTSNCVTCDGLSCHKTVQHKTNGLEYNVHISTLENSGQFCIDATLSSNTSSPHDIHESSLTEEQAVKFICDNFDGFKCF